MNDTFFFDKLLIWTGIRKEIKTPESLFNKYIVKSIKKHSIIDFLKRDVISSSKQNNDEDEGNCILRRPRRNVTRKIFKRTYKRELSPERNDETIIDIPGLNEIPLDNIFLSKEFENQQKKNKILSNVKICSSWIYSLFIFSVPCAANS